MVIFCYFNIFVLVLILVGMQFIVNEVSNEHWRTVNVKPNRQEWRYLSI